MPNRYFAGIWLLLLSFPFFFLIIFPTISTMNVELNQKVVDPHISEGVFDLEEPISYHLQWSVVFSLNGYPWGYLIWPHMISGGNWSAPSSQGWFVTNFSMCLNDKFSYNFWVSFQVPYDPSPTSYGFAEVVEPSLEEVKYNIDFSTLHSGENNLTIKCHFYSKIEKAGKANMDIHIGPLTVDITGLRGADGIPDMAQPLPRLNAYLVTFICGIIFLPVAEAVCFYGKWMIQQLKQI
ncbi:MAG: hypothetical protein ACFFBQ_14625 [Promethearchaeota archaeon]